MSLVALIIILLVLGVIAYAVRAYAPVDPTFKNIITAVLVVIALLVCGQAFGVCGSGVSNMQVPRLG